MRPVRLAAALLAAAATPEGHARSGPDLAPAVPAFTVPAGGAVVKEARYRMSAGIRPLLFWIGRGDVGGARIVWRHDGVGRKGYVLLLGSDPARAPRRINRWSWVREDADGPRATMTGLMNRSEDDSLDQAKAGLQSKGSYFFKLNRARVEDGAAPISIVSMP